jgi:hypothetical protein
MFSACFYLASILFMFYISRAQVAEALRRLFVYSTDMRKENKRLFRQQLSLPAV